MELTSDHSRAGEIHSPMMDATDQGSNIRERPTAEICSVDALRAEPGAD